MSDPINKSLDRIEERLDHIDQNLTPAFEQAYALLVVQLSALAQRPDLRARLDQEQRHNLRFLCEDLARELRQESL
jgi:hypothetical protein